MGKFVRNVLFICKHNSARSQMAEALMNTMAPDKFHAESAGMVTSNSLNPLAIEAMSEIGIDISGQLTKKVVDVFKDTFNLFIQGRSYSFIITVCDEATAEKCPVFPGKARRVHWSLPDPATFEGSEEDKMAKIREVRDVLREIIRSFIEENS